MSIKFIDALDALIDYRGKTPTKTKSGVPLITAKIVKNGFIQKPEEFIAHKDYEKWMTRGYPEIGDVVMTTEAPLGEVAILKNKDVVLAQRIITLRGKKNVLNSTYLKYYLQSTIGQSKLMEKETGTTVTGIKQSELREIEITIPPLPLQNRIAEILGALDDKIEINRQMNQTLEEMAQALYKHYFVYDIAPENLPEGWKIGKLSEVLNLEYGKSLRESERQGGQYPVIGSGGIVGYHNTYLVGAKGIVVGRKGNAGVVIWCDKDCYPIDTTFYVVSKFSEKRLYYSFFLLKSLNLQDYNSDSAVPGLNRNQAHNAEIIIPPEKIIETYNTLAEGLFDLKESNTDEIQSLSNIRDFLLPKFISGEIIPADLQTIEKAL